MKGTLPSFTAVDATEVARTPRVELVVDEPSGAHKTLVFEQDLVRIGSHESNDVVIADEQVSRFHCRLVYGSGQWRVCDAGSLNGTRLEGVRVRDADLPPAGGTIGVGRSSILARSRRSTRREVLPRATTFGALHGRSEAMRRMFALIEKVAQSPATVLIEGESGTGKELVATELVHRSPRATGPLVIVDCGAIAPQLVESTLFGHARGAFTGADRDREGALEAANGGTLFLDEIGELPLDMQPRLLRVLESRTVCRVGETKRRPIDVRIIAATNRHLSREMNRGRFREDLYFRLSVVTIRVPSLRDRLDDLELLVGAILDNLGVLGAEDVFTPEVLARMADYDWPGNVRELRNYVERAVLLRAGHEGALELPPPSSQRTTTRESGVVGGEEAARIVAPIDTSLPFRAAKEALVAEFEKKYVLALLERMGGNVTRAAKHARMDRINLHRVMQRHKIGPARERKD